MMKKVQNIRKSLKYISCFLFLCVCLFFPMTVKADSVSGGSTGQGGISGSNNYSFRYDFVPSLNSIVLTVSTTNPIADFGGTDWHTFYKDDFTPLNTSNPQLTPGYVLDTALQQMIGWNGYNLTVEQAKAQLNALGYRDKGNGVWICDGGYLTYVEGIKISPPPPPKVHTVAYDLNGGKDKSNFPKQTKTEGQWLDLHNVSPERTGYTFLHWNNPVLGDFKPGAKYKHDQDGGTVTLTAQWKDSTPPMVNGEGEETAALKVSPENVWKGIKSPNCEYKIITTSLAGGLFLLSTQ